MKKCMLFLLVVCALFVGCNNPAEQEVAEEAVVNVSADAPVKDVPAEPVAKTYPLPDTTMDNLTDAILSISLEEGDAYVDDTGKMQMDVKIYSFDKYDLVDMSLLKAGDVLVTHAGEVALESLNRNEDGSVSINGGLDNGGFDLVTDDCGYFYERGFSDAKNWYELGEATIRVSVDFTYHDTSDPEKGDVLYYPGSFLIGEVTDYNFTPFNTTIRVENGQIIEMHRQYVP